MITDTVDISKALKVVNIPQDSVISGFSLLSFDNYVLYTAKNSDDIIKIFNLTDRTLNCPIKTGRAENELLFASSIHKTGDSICIVDFLQNKIMYLRQKGKSYEYSSTQPNTISTSLSHDGDILIGEYSLPENKYILIQGIDTIKYGTPSGILPEYTNIIAKQLTRGRITVNPQTNRFAFFMVNVEGFQIIDYSSLNNIETIYSEKFGAPLKFTINSKFNPNQVFFNDESVNTFIDQTSDNDNIYALFSGKLLSKNDCGMCNHILVFDWDGEPKYRMYSDRNIQSVSLNKERNELYMIVEDYDLINKIMSFDLSKIDL